MGMPVTVEVVDKTVKPSNLEEVFNYFIYVENKFSVFKDTSEISLINQGKLKKHSWSPEMKTIFKLSKQTKRETDGYFNIRHRGKYNPSGLVKGWAIYNAAGLLKKAGFENFYVEAGGDIQVYGKNNKNKPWKVGVRNPFNRHQIIKTVVLNNEGIATSGTYIRGQHVYNPHKPGQAVTDIVSLTVIGPNVYEADRFATSAFAMGKKGIQFIETLPGFEGYLVDNQGMATFTSGFNNYLPKDDQTG